MMVFFTNLSLMESQVRYLVLFLLFSAIGGFGWFLMGNLHKNIQLIGVSQGSIVGATLLQLYINDLPNEVIYNISIYADDTLNVIRHLICGQQLELASEPKSDLRDTVDWIRKSGFPIVGGEWACLPTILRPSSLKNEAPI